MEKKQPIPKKLNEYSYLVEKEGSMRVPLKIFASEKLMEKMLGDKCIEQGVNSTILPGIRGYALMMPDAHQGYGFSIGGVAAVDAQEGCISPGGIGFDINCLKKGTKVLSEHGYFKAIEDYEYNFIEISHAHPEYEFKSLMATTGLVTLDIKQKQFIAKVPTFFMKKPYTGSLIKIQTKSGYTLEVTPEHPILTEEGMKASKLIHIGDKIAVNPFEGVAFSKPTNNSLLLDDIQFTKQQADELRKRDLLNLNLNHPKLPIIAKLFGYLLGDGSIFVSKNDGSVNAYGSKEDLITIQEDLNKLGFSGGIYSRKRNHSIPTRYGVVAFSNETHELHCASRSLANLFFQLGYPKGNKTITPYNVPNWIMKSPLWIKRLFLSGLFGAELSTPRTHTKTGFDCPTVSMSKNVQQIKSGRNFAIQLMSLLEEFEINVHKLLQTSDFHNKHGKTERLRIQISSEEENLLKLWSTIGFSYNKKRERLSQIAIFYIKEKMWLTQKRRERIIRIKELRKKGLTLHEVQDRMESPISNKRFIERHYYDTVGNRIPLSFPGFKDYVKLKSQELDSLGCLYDSVVNISSVSYNDYVYDFTLDKTHNFISNNIVVSNCGVRLLTTDVDRETVQKKIKNLLENLFKYIPPGVGEKSVIKITDADLVQVLTVGVQWALTHKLGTKEDAHHCEENGTMAGADPSKVSMRAKGRGRGQLGTLGAGNHFVEVQYVEKIYDKKVAKVFGLEENQVVVMIHTGSRGLGHQVCSDYLRAMEEAFPEIVKCLPDKDLIYAPASSQLAKDYYAAMCAAANFAWANRHVIGHHVRQSFKEIFGNATKVETVYDVAHNIAKLEEHIVDKKKFKAYVHRKGATRAFGPGRMEIPDDYRSVGQPILIPGSMGTASYVLVGTEQAMQESFGSTAHGAGRLLSRHEANRRWSGDQVKADLEKQHISIKAASWKGITEEAPGAYKDVDEVVKVSHDAGIGKTVARLRPIGVVKG